MLLSLCPVGGGSIAAVLGKTADQVQALEDELDRRRGLAEGLVALHAQPGHDLGQPGYLAGAAEQLGAGDELARLDRAAVLELGQQPGQVGAAEAGAERLRDGAAEQVDEDLLLASLLADLELDLAPQRRHQAG